MNVGGPAIQVHTISLGIQKTEFDQLLLVGKCQPGEIDYLELTGLSISKTDVLALGRSINVLADLKALLFIRKQLVAFAPDILHTHTFKAGLLGRIASFTVRKRILTVHTFHGHLLEGYFEGVKYRILVLLERFLAKRTNLLVSVGEKVMNDLVTQKIGQRPQYRIIPPGFAIDREMEKQGVLSVNRERHSEFTCLWVGRLVEIKRPDRVLEIATALKKRGSTIRFLIAGDGPLRKQLESQSMLESLPIIFLGWQKNIFELLTQVDLLLLTSANEGTPISIIEAQRMARPVISTNVGSVSEVMIHGETGFTMNYNIEDFVEKIELLSANYDLYSQFSENARRYSSERFSSDRLVSDYVRVYRDLIAGSKT